MIKFRLRQAGFTLIEILIVLFIMSIVTGAALLSLRVNENYQVEAATKEIVSRLKYIQEQAILLPAILGGNWDGQEWQLFAYVPVPPKPGQATRSAWMAYEDDRLTTWALPDTMVAELKVAQSLSEEQKAADAKANKPSIIFSSNGSVTPFSMSVGTKGKKPRLIITAAEGGLIQYAPFS